MRDVQDADVGRDFIEDADWALDPNDHYTLQHVASGRAKISDADDQPWLSLNHFIGRFWMVEPPDGQPELVSYRQRFADAELIDDEFLSLHPSQTFDVCWNCLGEGDQHPTPHQKRSVDGKRSNHWPRGQVVYEPGARIWLVKIADDLVSDERTLLAVRQRFVIDEASCRVIGDSRLN